jgi:hypothetical protein
VAVLLTSFIVVLARRVPGCYFDGMPRFLFPATLALAVAAGVFAEGAIEGKFLVHHSRRAQVDEGEWKASLAQ